MKRLNESSDSEVRDSKRQSRLGNDGLVTAKFTLPTITGRSQKIADRASIFQSFFNPLESMKEISNFVKEFRQSTLCDGVDHAMLAYRISDSVSGVSVGFDDDGERFAGKKLADLLDSMDIFGLVIVIRQYGGIMLGPIRFQHITQCAREAIMDYRRVKSIESSEMSKTKRLLLARDKTITALREITRQKREDIARDEASNELVSTSQSTASGSQNVSKDYSEHDLIVLKRLIIARDMTIKSLRTALENLASTTDSR